MMHILGIRQEQSMTSLYDKCCCSSEFNVTLARSSHAQIGIHTLKILILSPILETSSIKTPFISMEESAIFFCGNGVIEKSLFVSKAHGSLISLLWPEGRKTPAVTSNRAVDSDSLGFGICMHYCGMRWKLNSPDLWSENCCACCTFRYWYEHLIRSIGIVFVIKKAKGLQLAKLCLQVF